jgi:2'-5' RNA ligase
MRLFVAVDPDEEVRRAAVAASRRIAERIRQVDARTRIVWVAGPNLHLTIRFIGEVDDHAGRRVQEALSVPFEVAPFHLGIGGGAGAFPPAREPRTIWLGVTAGTADLRVVHGLVEQRLREAGLPPEGRDFTAHLTIGRVKDTTRGTAGAVRAVLAAARVDEVRCPIDIVTLYRSRLSPGGAEYEALLRTPLRSSHRT